MYIVADIDLRALNVNIEQGRYDRCKRPTHWHVSRFTVHTSEKVVSHGYMAASVARVVVAVPFKWAAARSVLEYMSEEQEARLRAAASPLSSG